MLRHSRIVQQHIQPSAFLAESLHRFCPHRFFDRNSRVQAMLIEQIDDVQAESAERGLPDTAGIFLASIHAYNGQNPHPLAKQILWQ